jgi:hypothetical protein
MKSRKKTPHMSETGENSSYITHQVELTDVITENYKDKI